VNPYFGSNRPISGQGLDTGDGSQSPGIQPPLMQQQVQNQNTGSVRTPLHYGFLKAVIGAVGVAAVLVCAWIAISFVADLVGFFAGELSHGIKSAFRPLSFDFGDSEGFSNLIKLAFTLLVVIYVVKHLGSRT
jgi:hypothetical protein